MDLVVLIHTNHIQSFRIDYLHKVRNNAVRYIRNANELAGLDREKTLVLKRMYSGIFENSTLKKDIQEIDRQIELRMFNIINL